jgi:hypothetical protein
MPLSRDFVDALTIAVRGGIWTPQPEDEEALRAMAGMPGISQATKDYWDKQSGVRAPITLAKADGSSPASPFAAPGFEESPEQQAAE